MEATSSKTGALAAEIQTAIEVLPASHRIEPQDGELVDNSRDGYIRLQDWVFIQGFAFVKESTRGFYIVFIIMIQQVTIEKQRRKIKSALGLPIMQWV